VEQREAPKREPRREQLITDNFGLVYSCASKLKPKSKHRDLVEDLHGEGFKALIRAADGFDFDHGGEFSTYAVVWFVVWVVVWVVLLPLGCLALSVSLWVLFWRHYALLRPRSVWLGDYSTRRAVWHREIRRGYRTGSLQCPCRASWLTSPACQAYD